MAVLESHMAKSHKPAWATIQKERDDALVEEDRAFQRKQTEALQALVERLALGQVIPDEEIQQAAEATLRNQAAEESQDDTMQTVTCDKCDFTAEGKTMAGALASLRAHEKREHPTTE